MTSIQDVLYGAMDFSPLLLGVIDTPYFQRLQRLLQLGPCHYIYPTATHTRKSHCLGTSYLAGVWMKHLQTTQPELHITERLIDIVRLAALIHDIGHTMFSHTFDHGVAPGLQISRKDHEDRSVHLLKVLVREKSVDITETEQTMVAAMIRGYTPPLAQRGSAWPDYLFSIVASYIDVDKMDYLMRDSYYTGVPCGFQWDRLIRNTRVIDDQMCFNRKIARNILQLFHTRYYFHSEIYSHKTAMVISAMLSDAITQAADDLGLETDFQHDTKWCRWDDYSVCSAILECKNAIESQEILNRIECRDLYPKTVTQSVETKTVPASDTVRTTKVGYLNDNVNPLSQLWFYDKARPSAKYKLPPDDETFTMMPTHFAETRTLTFTRSS